MISPTNNFIFNVSQIFVFLSKKKTFVFGTLQQSNILSMLSFEPLSMHLSVYLSIFQSSDFSTPYTQQTGHFKVWPTRKPAPAKSHRRERLLMSGDGGGGGIDGGCCFCCCCCSCCCSCCLLALQRFHSLWHKQRMAYIQQHFKKTHT